MERLKGLLFGAFVGDAYALSYNGIYDKEKLIQDRNLKETYRLPIKNSLNYGKIKGDFTHIGDQSLLLLKSIASENTFSINAFKLHWITHMRNYEGYIDNATKESLSLLDSGTKKGSSSDDLGGLARIAPLIFYHCSDLELPKYIELQTRLTHNNEFLIQLCAIVKDLVFEVLDGKSLTEAIEYLAQKYSIIATVYKRLLTRMNEDTFDVVKDIGQVSSSRFAFPSALYLMLKYQDDFTEALYQNAQCGGDTASRGMFIGMILGAVHGYSNIPIQLIESLNDYALIHNFAMRKPI